MHIDIICSWCSKHQRTKVVRNNLNEKNRVSHTICPGCREKVMNEYKKTMKPFIARQSH